MPAPNEPAPNEPARVARSGEDEARDRPPPWPGTRHPFLVARRGAIFHGAGRAPVVMPPDRAQFGTSEATVLPPPRRPQLTVHPRVLAGPDATLRAAVMDSPVVRAAADDLVARMTAPTGLRGLWRRLLAKEPRPPMRRQVAELVDAVHETARKHRGTPPLEEQALLRDLLRARFQSLDPRARKRWLRRVTDGRGTFARERLAQRQAARAMAVQHWSDAPYLRAGAIAELFFAMKQLAPEMIDHPPILRPPVVAPPQPPGLLTPTLSEALDACRPTCGPKPIQYLRRSLGRGTLSDAPGRRCHTAAWPGGRADEDLRIMPIQSSGPVPVTCAAASASADPVPDALPSREAPTGPLRDARGGGVTNRRALPESSTARALRARARGRTGADLDLPPPPSLPRLPGRAPAKPPRAAPPTIERRAAEGLSKAIASIGAEMERPRTLGDRARGAVGRACAGLGALLSRCVGRQVR